MSFFINHRFGGAERDLPASTFPLLLDELEVWLKDEKHTSISVIHESEWGLGIYYGGYVTFEHVEGDGEPRHMRNVPREKVLDMTLTMPILLEQESLRTKLGPLGTVMRAFLQSMSCKGRISVNRACDSMSDRTRARAKPGQGRARYRLLSGIPALPGIPE
jgi:hypothetical protein